MFKENKDFYPTPKKLIAKMMSKVKKFHDIKTILEPSAGSGAIIDYIKEENRWSRYEIMAIENDHSLRSILLGKKIKVIDTDFLLYNGLEKFDLIVANFPFSDGEKHLLKALEVLFRGQIVCLLNAETIKNPYTNNRKDLVAKLNKLGAEIEYIQDAFLEADRKTGVEVALIYINKEASVETHLFDGMVDTFAEFKSDSLLEDEFELTTNDGIVTLVREYNRNRDIMTKQIVEFYKNYKYIGKYLELSIIGADEDRYNDDSDLTDLMQKKINDLAHIMKKKYWYKALNLKEIDDKMTSSKREEVHYELKMYSNMDFTEANIRQFVLNLVEKFPKMIDESILSLFDKFTQYALKDNRWCDAECKGNIHYFNAWKSNSGYKVNKKVVLPFYGNDKYKFMDDVDKVVAYFSPQRITGSTAKLCEKAVDSGQNRKIETDFFYISIFKKGTIHFEFKNEEVLRLFNIESCKLKNFLPMDYSEKEFENTNQEEKSIINEFEGTKNYKKISTKRSRLGFNENEMNLLVEYKKEA